jgi:hypothetical protein
VLSDVGKEAIVGVFNVGQFFGEAGGDPRRMPDHFDQKGGDAFGA